MNDEFLEIYIQVNELCMKLFDTDKGIIAYIEEMTSIKEGGKYVTEWKTSLLTLKRLTKEYNAYVNEGCSALGEVCDSDDVKWLQNFYKSCLNRTDPLSVYYSYIINTDVIKILKEHARFQNIGPDEIEKIKRKQSKRVAILVVILSIVLIAGGVSMYEAVRWMVP